MENNCFSYSTNANVFKKSYGDIHLTVILELPKTSLKKTGRENAVNVLRDDICNLLNDEGLEKLLTPQKGGNQNKN